MQKKVNYTILGIAVVSLTVVLVALFFWLYSGRVIKDYHMYELITSESVAGLKENSVVSFKGVKVGYVSSIDISDLKNPNKVRVLLKVDDRVRVTQSFFATLSLQGVIGGLSVVLDSTHKTNQLLQPVGANTYPIIPVKSSFFSGLKKNISKTAKGMQSILNEKNAKAISAILTNVKGMTAGLSREQKNISAIIENLKVVMKNTSKATADLPQLMVDLRTTVQGVHRSASAFTKAALALKDTAIEGKIMISNFANQSLPQLPPLLQKLNGLAFNLNQLSGELQRQPSILLRGKAVPALGPGEK
jgi:phospholipid/cholesterol/gamma-HCH transport system substrate-binding protein